MQLIVEFENTFKFTPKGDFKSDHESITLATSWWKTYRLDVAMITGIATFPVEFSLKEINDNTIQLLNMYALSYTAYLKCCKTMNRDSRKQVIGDLASEIQKLFQKLT